MAPKPPNFNPFAALGLDPTTATQDSLRNAYFQSLRHRHETTTIRLPATAGFFPLWREVIEAYEYLKGLTFYGFRNTCTEWARKHRVRFNPLLPVGDPGVFVNTTATATPSRPPLTTPSNNGSVPRSNFSTSSSSSYRPSGRGGYSSGGSSYQPRATRQNPQLKKADTRARNSNRPSGSGAGAGTPGSQEDPFVLSSSDDESDGPTTPTPKGPTTPTPKSRSRLYNFSSGGGHTTTNSRQSRPYSFSGAGGTSSANAASGGSGGPASGGTTSASGAHRASLRSRRGGRSTSLGPRGGRSTLSGSGGRRSSGDSTRFTPIANPVTNDRITVGTWANATAANANTVVAGFDTRGRVFYRITNRDLNGNPVPRGPTATTTRFEDINFRAPYRNMDASEVRLAVDRHLRMNAFQRP
jgi:hypothetical protein